MVGYNQCQGCKQQKRNTKTPVSASCLLTLSLAFPWNGQQKNGHPTFSKQSIIQLYYAKTKYRETWGPLLEKAQVNILVLLKFKRLGEMPAHEKCSVSGMGQQGQLSWEGCTAAGTVPQLAGHKQYIPCKKSAPMKQWDEFCFHFTKLY